MSGPRLPLASHARRGQDFTANLSRGDAGAQFVANVGSNIAFVAVTMISMLLFVPYLIRNLGVAAYGAISLANLVVLYVATFSSGITSAATRFLAIDLGRHDDAAANATFNSAIAASAAFIAAALLPLLAVGLYSPSLFRVPETLEWQTRILLLCAALYALLNLIVDCFSASTVILHRFEIRNALRALGLLLRISTVLLLFAIVDPQVWHIGAGLVLSVMVSLFASRYICRMLTPQLRVASSDFDRSRAGELAAFSGWALLNSIGILLFATSDLIVINQFFGATATGHFAVLVLFPEVIRQGMDAITSVTNPSILARYARRDLDGLRDYTLRAVKLIALGLVLPVGLLVGLAQPLLELWLGSDFAHLKGQLMVMSFPICVTMATLPLSYVLTAYNKVRVQSQFTAACGIVCLLAAVAAARWGGQGPVGVVMASASLLVIRSCVLIPAYAGKVTGWGSLAIYRHLMIGVLATALVALAAHSLASLSVTPSWQVCASIAAAVTVPYLVIAATCLMNGGDRAVIASVFPFKTLLPLPTSDWRHRQP